MDADIEVFRGHWCNVLPADYSLCPEDVPHPNVDPYFTLKVMREMRYYNVRHFDFNRDKSNIITIPIRGISEDIIEQITNHMLSAFDIPQARHNSMATKIVDAAGNMINNTHKNDKILDMLVYIGVYIYYRDNDNYSRALEASMEEHQHNNNGLVPASDSSIEGLPMEEFKQVQGSRHCVICLRVFVVGVEIIRMPCSHFFHRTCIVRWLHRKNDCPLCRFQMPTDDH